MRSFVCISAAVCALAHSASAQHQASETGVNKVIISEFTGRIEISQSDGPATSVEHVGRGLPPNTAPVFHNGALLIVGEKRPKKFNIDHELNWRLHKNEAFARYLDDYGVLKVETAAGCEVEIADTIAEISMSTPTASVKVIDGWLRGDLGDLANATLEIDDHANLDLGRISGHLRSRIGGNASVAAVSAGSAELLVGGSAKLSAENIAGDVLARVSSSGDILLGDIGGALDASVAGSGDIVTGMVNKGGAYSISGSGDIQSRHIIGETTAHIAGNGDIIINGGRAENLKVSILGPGDFSFGGLATNVNAIVTGSGTLAVARSEGHSTIEGFGDVSIGDTSNEVE